MKVVTAAAMRELDRRTIEEHGTPGALLMERAATGVAREVLSLVRGSKLSFPAVLCIAGRGNNGGDACAAARLLHERGVSVSLWLAGRASDLQGDAAVHFRRMQAAGVVCRELPDAEQWRQVADEPLLADIVVDGVLGTGATGAPRGTAEAAIAFIRMAAHRALILAVDIPSGLDADTGIAAGVAVQADVTVTFGLPKSGLLQQGALDYVGSVKVTDIGIPDAYVAELADESDVEFLDAVDVRALLPRRPRQSHKGDYGRVLLVGGAAGYSGAMSLAAAAALRGGAGLVHVLVPRSLVPVVAAAVPSAMVQGGIETNTGELSSDVWADMRRTLDQFQAVLIGPGLTRGGDALVLVKQILRDCRCPLVLDADAITVLQGQPDAISHAACPVVMTPHPGEFAQLFEQDTEAVQADRAGMALAAAKLTGATVALKGAGTVVVQRDRLPTVSMAGNPGMAAGGSGDVLAGLIVALLGQGLDSWAATCAGVYLHGRAGDLAALRDTQACMDAALLIDFLAGAFREIHPR